MNIILLGHPGSGKGTQAKLISRKFGIPHISSGEMFRDIAREDTGLGRKVRELINNGNFVPDGITLKVVKERLSKDDCGKGFILDGFPRNKNQAIELDKMARIDKAVHIHVEDTTVLKRLSSRWQCRKCNAIYGIVSMPKNDLLCDKCGTELHQRADDMPEKIKRRIEIYHDETKPLVDYYKNRGVFVTVDGEKGIDEVFRDICKVLEK